MQDLKVKCSVKFSLIVAYKDTQVYFYRTIRKQTVQGMCFMNKDSRIHRNMKIV